MDYKLLEKKWLDSRGQIPEFKNFQFEVGNVLKADANEKRYGATGNVAFIEGFSGGTGNKDSYNDIIIQGAYEETIAKDVHWNVLRHHDPTVRIGFNGEAEDQKRGLKTVSVLSLDNSEGSDQYHLSKLALDMGAKDAHSIGFIPLEWSIKDIKGERVRYIEKIDMWEHSFVAWGANDKAFSTALKQWEKETEQKDHSFGLGDYVDKFFKFLEGAGFKHTEVKDFLLKEEREQQQMERLSKMINQTAAIFKKAD